MNFRGIILLIVALTWATNAFLLNKLHSAPSIEGTPIAENIDASVKLATGGIKTSAPRKESTVTNTTEPSASSKSGILTNTKKAEVGVIKGVITSKLAKLSKLKDKKVALMKTLLAAKLAPIVKLLHGKSSLIQFLTLDKRQGPEQVFSHGLDIFRKPQNLFAGALSVIPGLSSLSRSNVAKEYILIPMHAELGGTPAGVQVYENWQAPIMKRVKHPHVLFNALVTAKKHAFPGSKTEAVTEPCTEVSSNEDNDYSDSADVGSPLPIFQPEPFRPDEEVLPEHAASPAPVFEYQPPAPIESNFPGSFPPAQTFPPLNYGPPVQFPTRVPETSYGVPING